MGLGFILSFHKYGAVSPLCVIGSARHMVFLPVVGGGGAVMQLAEEPQSLKKKGGEKHYLHGQREQETGQTPLLFLGPQTCCRFGMKNGRGCMCPWQGRLVPLPCRLGLLPWGGISWGQTLLPGEGERLAGRWLGTAGGLLLNRVG